MATSRDLITARVLKGRVGERLGNVAAHLGSPGVHHCVVLTETGTTFVGLIQLADLIGRSNPGNRILGDLISAVQPMTVSPDEPATRIADLFEAHQLTEAVVLAEDGDFVGLITAQSVLEWSLAEYRRGQAALGQAVQRMQEALQAKDNFMAAVSHELRTPLNPVLLIASEAAQDPRLTQELRNDFAMIAEHVRVEARLVDHLIDQSALWRGGVAMERNRVALHDVLRAVVANLEPSLAANEISFALKLAGAEPVVLGDVARLHQVFTELLTNAVKFTPRAGLIAVTTRIDQAKHEVFILIANEGSGFSAVERMYIFEPFRPLQEVQERSGGGSSGLGLGLSISRGLVEMHGGRIRADSAGPGQGAAFEIVLPIESEPNPDASPMMDSTSMKRW